MARRKIPSTATGATNGGVFLDDDEQLVEEVTTTKKIGRQRRSPDADAEPIAAVPVFEDLNDDNDDDDEQPSFSQTSLAASIYGTDGETIQDQVCTIVVRRNPDTLRDKFVVPCSALTNLPRLVNVSLTAEKGDIEDQIRNEYGGGHYFLQVQMDGRLGHSWKPTLADLPGWRPPTGETAPQPIAPAAPVAAAPAADPMDSMLASMEKQKRMRDLLFGDAEKRMQAEIDRLRTEAEAAKNAIPPPVVEPMSEELLLWKMARDMPDSDAKTRLLDKLTPVDSDGNRHWIADLAAVAMENKDTILGLFGSLFGGAAPAAPQQNVMDMLRRPAPAALPQHRSAFSRTKPAADPAPAEPPPADDGNIPGTILPRSEFVAIDDLSKGDETAIDAEITNEVKDAKPKRKRNAAA